MKNFATCHCHPQSLDSASTPEAFAAREQELSTGVITVTDHGSLGACRKVYDLGKAKGLIPVLGLEAYFRDDNCPILLEHGVPKKFYDPNNEKEQKDYERYPDGTYLEYNKYFHVTLHFLDEAAFNCGVRLLSKADLRAEQHGSERKPLFDWQQLEELLSHNVTVTTGCLVGMVQRHVLEYEALDIALAYYEKLRGLAKPGHFFVEVFPHDCSRNFVQGVSIELTNGESLWYYDRKMLKTDAGEIRSKELAEAWNGKNNPHKALVGVKNYRTWETMDPREIKSVTYIEDFVANPCRPWAEDGDVQAGLNKVMLAFAERYGDPILIGDDSHFAHKEEKVVQDVRLAQNGSWRFYGSYHRQSSDEAFKYFNGKLGIDQKTFEGWVDNSHEWASRFKDFKFTSAISLPVSFYEKKYCECEWYHEGDPDNSLQYTFELIKKHGRMPWGNEAYEARLQAEIEMLHYNGKIDLLPYFFIDEEVCSLYEELELLTGPGRGSAAGLLLAYLLGITHVDPLKYGLSMERFMTMDRIRSGKLPDIDQDLPTRDPLVNEETGWLKQRFGDCYAQISVDTTLKLKSAVKDVARMKYGRVPEDVEKWSRRFEMPPQGVNDYDFVLGYDTDEGRVQGSIESDEELKQYIANYPEDWEVVKKCLGLGRQKGRHACAYVIADKPIHEFIPLTTVSGVRVTQYTAGAVEASGGLKMDFLVVNTLNDIGDCIKLIQKRSGVEIPKQFYINGRRVPRHRLIPWNGSFVDVYDLPEDQAVLREVSEGRTETVFQFNTNAAVKWLSHFNYEKGNGSKAIDSIEAMAAFTALDRPGPLNAHVGNPDSPGDEHNMLVEYARRSRGATKSHDILPVFDELFPETYGIMVYQEQLQKLYQKITGCPGAEAEQFRSDVAKKQKAKIEKAYPKFMKAASERIGQKDAQAVWDFVQTWAEYGFNKSHAVCYSVIGYVCAWLKHHFKLEWWCSVLKNADKVDVNEKFWAFCGHLIDLPDVGISGPTFEIQNDRIRAPIDLLHGVGEVAHKQLCQYRPYTDIQDFCDKIALHQQNTGKWGDSTTKNKKTGETQTVKKFKKGHNALNQKVCYTLIVSGAMDSLFPATRVTEIGDQKVVEEITTVDKLHMYEQAIAKATGAKKPKPVDAAYNSIGPLERYQRRKAVLPAYGEDLVPYLVEKRFDRFYSDDEGRPMFSWNYLGIKHKEVRIVNYDELRALASVDVIPRGKEILVAAIGYVDTQRKWVWRGKECCEIILDIEGAKFKAVKWGGAGEEGNELPEVFNEDLEGGLLVSLYRRYRDDRPFTIESIVVLKHPLDHKVEESPEPEETNGTKDNSE